jgi:hypothetical protein
MLVATPLPSARRFARGVRNMDGENTATPGAVQAIEPKKKSCNTPSSYRIWSMAQAVMIRRRPARLVGIWREQTRKTTVQPGRHAEPNGVFRLTGAG